MKQLLTPQRTTTVYLWSLMTVFLFCCGSQGYLNMTQAKFTIFCILTGLYLAVLGLCLLLHRPRLSLKHTTWAQRLILLYLLLTWISTLLSPHRAQAILGYSRREGAVTITLYCVVFLCISAYGRATKSLLFGCAATALAFCLLCMVQLTGANPLGLYPQGLSWFDAYTAYSGAYLGTIGNVDLVAAYLCLVIPVLWVSLLRLRGRARWFLALPLAAALFVLVKISVLAGLVGVFGGAVLSLPVVLPLGKKGRILLACGIFGCTLAAMALIFAVDIGQGLWHELHELLHGRMDPAFGSGRLYIWQQVWQRIHPLFGTGPDTMLLARISPFSRYDANLGYTILGQIDVAHNDYLNILYHQGALALAAYLLALISLAVRWIRRREDPAAAILGSSVLCYCIQAFFGFSMVMTAPFFWAVLGILDSQTRSERA